MNILIGYNDQFNYIFNNLKNDTLNNSILISGNKGIGKYFFVTNLIKEYLIYSTNKENIKHHLSLLKNNTHSNIKVLKKEIDLKTNKIKNFITIDQVRNINFFSRETSQIENLAKFIIIDSADNLNSNAANSLLKILEEPKKNTYFFLISHQPSLLLPSIKSRCLKINLPTHNFSDFSEILISKNITDDETIKFLFDITNGSPGLSTEYNFKEILEIFDRLIESVSDLNTFSDNNIYLLDVLTKFDNEKLKIYLSLLKFILITIIKIKYRVNIFDYFLSSNIKKIIDISEDVSFTSINKKLEYLIKNENDLFTLNLDKKIFMINFFAER